MQFNFKSKLFAEMTGGNARNLMKLFVQLVLFISLFIPYSTKAVLYVDIKKAILVILILLYLNVHARQKWKVS